VPCCGNRAFHAYTVYGSAALAPDASGNPVTDPDWVVLGHVLGGPAYQTAAQFSATSGSLGVYRHLLFEVSSLDGVHDFFGEIDVHGRLVPEPATWTLLLGLGAALVMAARRYRQV
jgi:hypothetical protein